MTMRILITSLISRNPDYLPIVSDLQRQQQAFAFNSIIENS